MPACRDLLTDLRERGLNITLPILAVLTAQALHATLIVLDQPPSSPGAHNFGSHAESCPTPLGARPLPLAYHAHSADGRFDPESATNEFTDKSRPRRSTLYSLRGIPESLRPSPGVPPTLPAPCTYVPERS